MPDVRWFEVRRPARGDDEGPAQALWSAGAVAVEREGNEAVGAFLDESAAGAAGPAREIPPPDWSRDWLAEQQPIAISDRLVVAPRFVPVPPGPLVVRIDPGLAFGTATHPTTRLCLHALENAPPAPILDVGTGTGVLAIAALLLGAPRAAGTDIDPIALAAARRHARANRIEDARFVLSDGAPDANGVFPLVIANLPPGVHEALAPAIVRAAAPGATVLVSGFVESAAESVLAALERSGLRIDGRQTEDGWVLARGRA